MKNIESFRGDTLPISFSVISDIEIDLSSDSVAFTFSVKEKATDIAYVFRKDKSAITALGDNTFLLRIPPEDTVDLVPGYYYYDLQFDFGEDVYTLESGQLHLKIDITRLLYSPSSRIPMLTTTELLIPQTLYSYYRHTQTSAQVSRAD